MRVDKIKQNSPLSGIWESFNVPQRIGEMEKDIQGDEGVRDEEMEVEMDEK